MATSNSTYGYNEADFAEFTKYARYALFSFAFLYLFVYNARQNISYALPLIKESFGVGNLETGIITSSLFWCYGFGHFFSGRLSEIFTIKKFIVLGTILSILCNIAISFQTTLTGIAIFWGLNGFAQSMIWSPGFGMLAQWWPKKKRGHSTSIATCSASVAQIVTPLCIAFSPQWFGTTWQNCFRWPLIPTVFALLVFMFVCKDKPEDIGLAPFCRRRL